MELLPADVESMAFRVVQNGYDADEVHAYLKKVAGQMASLEERVTIALVKADRLERKLLDAERTADPIVGAYDDALDRRRRLLAEPEAEADRIGTAPGGFSEEFRHGATSDAAVADEILEAARAEAARADAEAAALLEQARSMAQRMEDEGAQIVREATARAERIVAAAVATADRSRSERSERSISGPSADGSALREPAFPRLDDAETRITVDLTTEPVTVEVTEREPLQPDQNKPSRYMSRSAGLPRIGEGAGSVLGDMQRVRKKETD